ncbi:MAG TPA: 50S ribosomal protein L6 [bacterium]|nr:50S ribosomal protein L6 [bacterium]
MSRIGKLPVALPKGVECSIDGSTVVIKGPKGSLSYTLPTHTSVVLEDGSVIVSIENPEEAQQRAYWGLARAMLRNMVEGVTDGYKKSLEVTGVGYKFDVASPTKLVLSIGFSHKVEMNAPEGVKIAPDEKEKNIIHISGIDRQQVGYFAALVRGKKPPEPYKGKGIHYLGEHIRRKAGKTAGKK